MEIRNLNSFRKRCTVDKAGARAACGVGLGAEARGWQGPGGTAARRGDGARPPRVGAGNEGRCTREIKSSNSTSEYG